MVPRIYAIHKARFNYQKNSFSWRFFAKSNLLQILEFLLAYNI